MPFFQIDPSVLFPHSHHVSHSLQSMSAATDDPCKKTSPGIPDTDEDVSTMEDMVEVESVTDVLHTMDRPSIMDVSSNNIVH
jgi:hypothetical protein